MQHFTTALLMGDLLARLHTLFALSALARYELAVAERHWFTLARAAGGGDWLAALQDGARRLSDTEAPDTVRLVAEWPISKLGEEEFTRFKQIAEPLAHLAAGLLHSEVPPVRRKMPLGSLFELLLQVRNKTVHGAYDSPFYADQVKVVNDAVDWIFTESPLWNTTLAYVTLGGQGRVLEGLAPTHTVRLEEFARGEVVVIAQDDSWAAGPLIRVFDGHIYIANGTWREESSSAEFLCHHLAANRPGQGTEMFQLEELARPPLPTVGQIVDGQYKIEKVLGEGEEAVVYLAKHTGIDARYVLKAFREPREAFDQREVEFEALRKIYHPGIPQIHEIHSWENPFHLRFDYVPGAPLETMRKDFEGSPKRLAKLAAMLAETLMAIHDAGYVHRDVAPDNILIPDDADTPVRLIDFDQVARIGTVGLAGTSMYRPPEAETNAQWTEGSDLYSLGVVLFELLTGRLPYVTSDGEVDRETVEPAAKDVGAFGDLVEVLRKAAALDPDSRHSNAREFLVDLRAASQDT